MHTITTLAVTFGVSLAAMVVVAVLFRMWGKKPNLWNIVAIPVGITVAEAVRLRWHISYVAFQFTAGAAIGLAVFCAGYLKARRGV